jgi:vitamin B12 transporter
MLRYVLVFTFFVALRCAAQVHMTDTLHELKAVEIQASRVNLFATGERVEQVDSMYQRMHSYSSVASVISESTTALLRSYGTGGLATLSFRGTQTTQSGVFWNGFNLNQPNMGMTDLSEIPSFFFDEISLQYGGASAQYGSGVIGGSLHLSSMPSFSDPLSALVSISAGSFSNYTMAAKVGAGNEKFAWTSAIFGNTDKNNFPYQDLADAPQRLDHALASSEGILNQLAFRINKYQLITVGNWWQHTDRQLPPTMTMAVSRQRQVDRASRWSLQWSYSKGIGEMKLRLGFFDEMLHYTNRVAGIDAIYNLQTLPAEAEYKVRWGEATVVKIGASWKYMNADVPYYKGNRKRAEEAFYASVIHEWGKSGWKSVVNIRQDLDSAFHIPFCPSVGVEGFIYRSLRARISASRNFRVPTMNDRYWIPGGNPGLLPESSFNQEVGLDWKIMQRANSLKLEMGITVYNMIIDNLIQWVNVTSEVWSPVNVQKVWSRGLEPMFRASFNKGARSGLLQLSYTYTPSTYLQSAVAGDNSEGKQLIYIPLHKVNAVFRISNDKWYGDLNASLNSRRFIEKDEGKALPAYFLINSAMGREFNVQRIDARLQMEIRNLTNAHYQVVQYYPEPGISVILNLIVKLNKNEKK